MMASNTPPTIVCSSELSYTLEILKSSFSSGALTEPTWHYLGLPNTIYLNFWMTHDWLFSISIPMVVSLTLTLASRLTNTIVLSRATTVPFLTSSTCYITNSPCQAAELSDTLFPMSATCETALDTDSE